MNNLHFFALSAVCAATLAAAAPASATDYNVDPVTNGLYAGGTPVSVTLAPGSYSLTAIGTAQGGLYNAWSPNSQSGCEANCLTSWLWSYAYFSSQNTIQLIGAGATFATAADALNAVQSGNSLAFNTFNITTQTLTPGSVGYPFNFTIDAPTTIGVYIIDGDGDYSHNLGGVSFRITAVPEPATWAMMIAGFGLVGAGLRRRKLAAV